MVRYTKTVALTLFVFLVAFVPRLVALNAFLTADEHLWVARSREFLLGILSGDWELTLQSEHPGVTTMWTGSLGILYRYWTRGPQATDDLLAFVRQVPTFPPDASYIAPMRFGTVLLMALFIALFYALVTRLFEDRRVGLVAALLLALNPYHIALSRVLHHDALESAFMTLSLLTLIGYFLKGRSWYWLHLSAIAAGLALLSKSPALFLIPFFALLGVLWAIMRWRQAKWQGGSDVMRLVENTFFWGGIAWLTIFFLWPAIRVVPLRVINLVVEFGTSHATQGHGWGNFFLGEISHDPGPLFYPLNWLLRTTPLELLGLFIWGCFSLNYLFRRQLPKNRSPSWHLSGLLLLYALLFMALMTVSAKKQDRYILPIYPVMDILAALGLVQLVSLQVQFARFYLTQRGAWALIGAGFVLQVGLLFGNYPYYFTYYNPLLGGAPTAARLTTVGWGEGLDQAAAYLNSLPNADQLHVASWYAYSLAPFFRGQVFAREAPPIHDLLANDYAVIYRNQIQRQLPNPHLMRYLLTHQKPVFTVTLQGLEYVYVYKMPLSQRSNWLTSRLAQKAILFGMSEQKTEAQGTTERDSNPDSLTLYWQNEGLSADQDWWFALQPADGAIGAIGAIEAWQACHLRPGFADERLLIGALLESECPLTTQKLSPGIYHLHLAVGADINTITAIPLQVGELGLMIK